MSDASWLLPWFKWAGEPKPFFVFASIAVLVHATSASSASASSSSSMSWFGRLPSPVGDVVYAACVGNGFLAAHASSSDDVGKIAGILVFLVAANGLVCWMLWIDLWLLARDPDDGRRLTACALFTAGMLVATANALYEKRTASEIKRAEQDKERSDANRKLRAAIIDFSVQYDQPIERIAALAAMLGGTLPIEHVTRRLAFEQRRTGRTPHVRAIVDEVISEYETKAAVLAKK